MKKGIIISIICGMIICSMAAYTFATTGIVKTDNLRLREGNSTSSEIVTLLSIGDKVEIISKTDNGWYKVKYKEYEGYVSSEYINADEEKIETTKVEEETTTPIKEEEQQQEVVNNVEVNKSVTKIISKGEKLYGLPLINANTVTIIENDVEAEVLAEANGWSYVRSAVFEGWMRFEKLDQKDDMPDNIANNDNTTANEQIGYISGNDVNFRREPTTSGEVISSLTLNREVIILENTNGWVKVKVGNEIGYVSATYVSNTKVSTTSRSSTSRRTQNKNNENTKTVEEVPLNPRGTDIVAYAKQYLGYKYVYGGSTPAGFDCSGFTQYVYKHFGYSLNRTSSNQASNGVGVSKSNMQPGDLICFSNSKGSTSIGHVGIYIGNGQFVHSANSRSGVIISNVDGAGFYYVCSRRII